MADISNQLQGADEGLERFIESLDNASIKLGSNAALESKLARQEIKRLDQEQRFKKKMQKMQAQQASQLAQMDALKIKEQKASLPVLKKMSAALKDRLKSTTVLNKGMKETIKGMKVFEKSMSKMKEGMKGGLGKGMNMLKGAAKAGIVGALVLGIKVIIDGMLKIDKSMATLVKSTGRARIGLEGLKMAAVETESAMGTLGVNLEVATKEAANLSQQFGLIDQVTTEVIQTSLKLQMAYGLGAQEAGQLLVTMERLGKNTEEFVGNLAVKGVKAGVNVSLVMRDMASHAQQYAMYNERAQQSMEAMAIQAARTGGSLADIDTMSAAYDDVDKIGENLGKVGTLLGKEVQEALGNPYKLYMLAEEGEWKKLQDIHTKAYRSKFELAKGEHGLMEISHGLLRSQVRALEAQTGESIVIIQNRILEADQIEKMGKLSEKQLESMKAMGDASTKLADLTGDDLIGNQQLLDIQRKMIKQAAQRVKDGKKAAKGEIKTFTKLSELKKPQLKAIKKEIDLRAKEAREAKKMNEIIKQSQTIVDRFKNIFAGIWGEFTTQMSLAFGLDDRDEGSVMGKMEEFASQVKSFLSLGTLAAEIKEGEGTPLENFVTALGSRLEKLFKPMFTKIGEWLMEALSGAVTDWKRSNAWADWLLPDTEKEDILEDIDDLQNYMARGTKGGTRRRQAFTEEDKFSNETRLAALQIKAGQHQELALEASRMMDTDDPEQIAEYVAAMVSPDALGRVHRGRGAALVGEAGGEVVVSRSALRSGIGVSGRAASALAGIGVPGFYRGGAIESTYATQGLAGAAGAQSMRAASASAFQAEQRNQQRAMVDYWRREYQRQMEEASHGATEERKKDSISWSTHVKKFFNAYPALIDKTLQKAFNVQDGVGAEMYKGVFTAMKAWSSGDSPKKALTKGVQAGLSESLKSGGTLDTFLKRMEKTNKVLADGIRAVSDTFARTGSLKQTGKAALGAGIQGVGERLFGSQWDRAAQYRSGTGAFGATLQGEEARAREEGYGSGDVPKKTGIDLDIELPKLTLDASKLIAGGGGGNVKTDVGATGKYVNSPTLMMVGEEGRGEVVVPTERIRKGLPINKGVANELGSIGVPGFANGGTPGGTPMDPKAAVASIKSEGWGGNAQMAAANAAFTFGSALMAGENVRQAGTQALSAGIGAGATAALMLIPPPGLGAVIGPLLGPMIGQVAGPVIGKMVGMIGGQKKGRKKSLKILERQVKSGSMFDFGQPAGLSKQMKIAIGGKENAPTEKNYNKLLEKISGSKTLKPLWRANIDPSMLIALHRGGLRGKGAFDAYAAINTALYGSAAGDKYHQAMQVGPQLAEGGIVTRPTQAIIGEKGPEVVIPLTEQRRKDKEMIDEMKKQNKLMMEMIKTQKETGKTEVRLDGRKISETVGENFYDIGSGQ